MKTPAQNKNFSPLIKKNKAKYNSKMAPVILNTNLTMTTNASLNFRTTLPTTQDSPRELYEETLKRFNLGSEWKTILDWYEIKEVVGAGSYGSVVKASCKFTGEIVAIKMVQNFTEHSYQLVKIIREI